LNPVICDRVFCFCRAISSNITQLKASACDFHFFHL
jgi:hypothetical protein